MRLGEWEVQIDLLADPNGRVGRALPARRGREERRLQIPVPCALEPLEPRVLLNGDTPGDLSLPTTIEHDLGQTAPLQGEERANDRYVPMYS